MLCLCVISAAIFDGRRGGEITGNLFRKELLYSDLAKLVLLTIK